MYVENKDLDSAGNPKPGVEPKPLFIRASEGDCLEHHPDQPAPRRRDHAGAGDPLNPVEQIGGAQDTRRHEPDQRCPTSSTRMAGRQPGLYPPVRTDPKYFATAARAAIGFNYDTTIGPGKSYTYKYFVDTKNIGVANLSDYGNLRTNRHHGAWGGLVVEPKGATYLNPKDLTALPSGDQAVIKYPDRLRAIPPRVRGRPPGRAQPVRPSTTCRSPDLPPRYDPAGPADPGAAERPVRRRPQWTPRTRANGG